MFSILYYVFLLDIANGTDLPYDFSKPIIYVANYEIVDGLRMTDSRVNLASVAIMPLLREGPLLIRLSCWPTHCSITYIRVKVCVTCR